MRLSINTTTCAGSGVCAAALPEIFDQDDEGTAVVQAQPADLSQWDLVRRVVGQCPTMSIAIDGDVRDR